MRMRECRHVTRLPLTRGANRHRLPAPVTSNSPDHLSPDEPDAVDELAGTYQPKRGLVAKVFAVLILVLLVAVPILLVLVTADRWAGPAPTSMPSTQPAEFDSQIGR
jgi:hypothetical protein